MSNFILQKFFQKIRRGRVHYYLVPALYLCNKNNLNFTTMFKSTKDADFLQQLESVDESCASFMRGNVSGRDVEIDTQFNLVPEVPTPQKVEVNGQDRQWLPIATTIGNISYRQFTGLKIKGVKDLYERFGDKTLVIADKVQGRERADGTRGYRLTIAEYVPKANK